MVRDEAFHSYCGEMGIRGQPVNTLLRLALKADWRTGAIGGFSLTEYASILGFGTQSGRRTLKAHLDALTDAGAVQYLAPPGRPWGGRGVLVLAHYDRYVRRDLSKARPAPDITARSRPGKGVPNRAVITQLAARRPRGYDAENGPSPANSSSSRSLTQTREIDPLPVPTEHLRQPWKPLEQREATHPGKAPDSQPTAASALVAEAEAQLGLRIFGKPRQRFEALTESLPTLVPRLIDQVRSMKGIHSIKLMLERLEEFALAEAERAQREQATRETQDRDNRIQSATRELNRTIGELVLARHDVDLPVLVGQTAAHFQLSGDEEARLVELSRGTERDVRFNLDRGPLKAMGEGRATLIKPPRTRPVDEPAHQEPHSPTRRLAAAVSWCSKEQLRHAGDLAYIWVKAGKATDVTALLIEKAVKRDPEFFPPKQAGPAYQTSESHSP
jgi:hypothetical protein